MHDASAKSVRTTRTAPLLWCICNREMLTQAHAGGCRGFVLRSCAPKIDAPCKRSQRVRSYPTLAAISRSKTKKPRPFKDRGFESIAGYGVPRRSAWRENDLIEVSILVPTAFVCLLGVTGPRISKERMGVYAARLFRMCKANCFDCPNQAAGESL